MALILGGLAHCAKRQYRLRLKHLIVAHWASVESGGLVEFQPYNAIGVTVPVADGDDRRDPGPLRTFACP
jgi:hypothetical protein